MRRKKDRTLAEAWEALKEQVAKGKPAPDAPPAYMSAGGVKLWPEVFQHRRPSEHSSAAHIRELQRAIASGTMDPVTVWWDGRDWACIDGHHRLKAYSKASKSDGLFVVQVFKGTPEQAIAEAARRNTSDKLQMSRTEKLGAAWRLVITTKMTKAETVQACGVSDGTVANMRRVRDKLAAQGEAYADMGWEAARRAATGEEQSDIDWDDRTEKEAQEIANRIVKALGQRASSRLDAFARALEIYDARLPRDLLDHWGALEDEDEVDSEAV